MDEESIAAEKGYNDGFEGKDYICPYEIDNPLYEIYWKNWDYGYDEYLIERKGND